MKMFVVRNHLTAWQRPCGTAAHALPRRGGRRRKVKSEPQQFSDDELIRELNSSHWWLPEEDADFGLDDVAAHVTSRGQAQVVDLTPPTSGSSSSISTRQNSNRGKGGRKRTAAVTAPADLQALSDIDPSSGQPMPDWVQDLQQAGFDVMTRDGQLFLQRGVVTAQPQQPQQQTQQPQQQPKRAFSAPAAAATSAAAAIAASTKADMQAAATQHSAEPQVSDRSLAVRQEFDPAVWQQHLHSQSGVTHDDNDADLDIADTAAGAWYAGSMAPVTSSSSANSSAVVGSGQRQQRLAGSLISSSSGGISKHSLSTAAKIQRVLLSFSHPIQLLGLLHCVFPAWVDNGCWMVSQSCSGVVCAPTPAEAAVAIKGLALAARRARLNHIQLQSLAREALVRGLAEALRLTPPRCPAGQERLSRRMWSVARDYWMQSGGSAAAAAVVVPRQLSAAATGSTTTTRQQQQQSMLSGSQVPSLGPLLAQLQGGGGGSVSKQQLSAAHALVTSRTQDKLRCTSVVNAVWGLSSLGGVLFFEPEVEALCQIAQAKFSRWSPSCAELSDVLWGLAHAQHWTSLLPQLEACLMAAGGPPSCSDAEVVTCLWSFAVLGHTPTQLLSHLDTHGWTDRSIDRTKSNSSSSSSGGRKSTAATNVSRKQEQPGSCPDVSSTEGEAPLSRLSDVRLCTLAWSLACLQQTQGRLMQAVWQNVCERGPRLCDSARQAVQIAQAALETRLQATYTPQQLCPGAGTEQLLSRASEVFLQQGAALRAQKAHSSYQRSIASILSRLRIMHVLEHTSTGYAVDIAVPSLQLAVEADGPSHFSRTALPSQPQRPLALGATAMKRRHLQGMGWAVVNIPYSDWDQTPAEQRLSLLVMRILAEQPAGAAAHKDWQQLPLLPLSIEQGCL